MVRPCSCLASDQTRSTLSLRGDFDQKARNRSCRGEEAWSLLNQQAFRLEKDFEVGHAFLFG